MVAARRRSASSGALRGLQRHVRRRARSRVQSNLPAMPTIDEGGLIPPISGQSRAKPSSAGARIAWASVRRAVDWRRGAFRPTKEMPEIAEALENDSFNRGRPTFRLHPAAVSVTLSEEMLTNVLVNTLI